MLLDSTAESTAAAVSGAVSGTASESTGFFSTSSLLSLLPILLLVVVFYFFIIRPQNKQQKQMREMRSSLSIGDTITTTGGVIGRVKVIKDDNVTIESAGQKLLIHRWAISSIDKKVEDEDSDDE